MSVCRCTKYVGKDPCIHDLKAIIEEQAEAIARVRDLHKPFHNGKHMLCRECREGRHDCYVLYPCPTINALDGEVDAVNDHVSTLTANADIPETSANADTDCQNSNESVAEPALDGDQ